MHTRFYSKNYFQLAVLALNSGKKALAFQYFDYSIYDQRVSDLDKAKASLHLGRHYVDKMTNDIHINKPAIERDVHKAREHFQNAVKFCSDAMETSNTAKKMLDECKENSSPTIHPL